MSTYHIFDLVSIDAWAEPEGGWYWNASYALESGIVFGDEALTPRKILNALREWGYLTPASKGRVTLVDDWPTLEIQCNRTGQPLLALNLTKTVEEAA